MIEHSTSVLSLSLSMFVAQYNTIQHKGTKAQMSWDKFSHSSALFVTIIVNFEISLFIFHTSILFLWSVAHSQLFISIKVNISGPLFLYLRVYYSRVWWDSSFVIYIYIWNCSHFWELLGTLVKFMGGFFNFK